MSLTLEKIKQNYRYYVPIPQRLILTLFGFLAIVNASTMRYCMDIALTQMVNTQIQRIPSGNSKKKPPLSHRKENARILPLNQFGKFNVSSTSNSDLSLNKDAILFNWSQQLQTLILTSFYVGYTLTHVPGARLAERYGGKWILAIGIFATAILTILTPWAIKVGGSVGLIVIRVITGLSEGPIVPALSAMLAQWVPPSERGKLASLVLSGGQVGILFGNVVSSLLLRKFEWSFVFYIFGGCALIWFICFILVCYSDPASNPFIEEPEKMYLNKEIGPILSRSDLPPTPWKDILTNAPVLALISATVQYDWTNIQINAQVPQFIKNMRNITLSESFVESLNESTPYLLNWIVSVVAGGLSDALVNHKFISRTMARKAMTLLTALSPNVFTSLAHCFACSEEKDMGVLYSCAIGAMGTYYAGIKLTALDMSPNYAATLTGISNGLGSLAGAVVPWLHSYIEIKNESPYNELRTAFWMICSALTSGEVQGFNQPPAQQPMPLNNLKAIKN